MNCAVHNQTQAVAYCRTCGKALCEDCKRDVMGAIYCEPCIAARLQGQPVPPRAAVPPPPPPAVPRVPGTPNPGVAAMLGFIPGVGAMYNGQFAKAFVHVVIFVLLILATDNLSALFGMLIGFFVIYMAFEAYKTAEAKRMGWPAPDPLGLDRLFGIQESQPAVSPAMGLGGDPQLSVPPPVQIAPPPPAQDSAPVGAIVLMILGGLFLLSNFGLFRVGRMWPLILIGVGLWIAYKRTAQKA
jgi:LiaI-LiaF-like transmembrane region/B-box zinc finger